LEKTKNSPAAVGALTVGAMSAVQLTARPLKALFAAITAGAHQQQQQQQEQALAFVQRATAQRRRGGIRRRPSSDGGGGSSALVVPRSGADAALRAPPRASPVPASAPSVPRGPMGLGAALQSSLL
jgi:hypothetical protein